MDAVAPPEEHKASSRLSIPLLAGGAILYAAITGSTVFHHEPWADEAQAWLLARDATLWELWTRLLHYEGTPGLWHTLLHGFIALGAPYAWLNLFSALLGLAGAVLILWQSPFPAPVRFLLPFTYFLCYQYAVVARSYSLLPVLLFACAAVYQNRGKRVVLLSALLCLTAGVSVHGLVLSVAIWCTLQVAVLSRWRSMASPARKQWILAGVAYLAVGGSIAFCAWPAADVMFVTRLNPSFPHFLEVSRRMFIEAFTGEWLLSALVLVLSLPYLWKGKALLVFVLSSFFLCVVSSVIYSQVWHDGILFLAWIFSLWIAASARKPDWAVLIALAVVIICQCRWTAEAVVYDFRASYSGSKAAAQYLQHMDLTEKKLYGIGYACTGVQPYFSRNLFLNFSGGSKKTYWDWSSRNHVYVNASEHLAAEAPDYVLVGYKSLTEKYLYDYVAQSSGYAEWQHFKGNLFWQTEIFEPEAFDLYRRTEAHAH